VDPIDPRLKAFPRVPASALVEILASGFAPESELSIMGNQFV
jgi:hypothetical protein